MAHPLDDAYFDWLYAKIAKVPPSFRDQHYEFTQALFNKEFLWSVPNDDNRIEDAMELRQSFVQEEDVYDQDVSANWMSLGCSMLELLIILAEKGHFETDEDVDIWFWRMVENAEFDTSHDSAYSDYSARHNEEVMDRIICRTYDSNGYGGLFPLASTPHDQTKIELWYQMSAWILENYDY